MRLLNNRKLLRLLQYLPIMVIVIFTIVLNVNVINSNDRKIEALVESIRTDVSQAKKQQIQSNIEQAFQQIEHEKKLVEKIARERLRFRVQTAVSIANGLLKANENKPIGEVKKLIADALRPIRFDDGTGYLYVYDMEGRNIMHPILPSLENKIMIDMEDTRGNFIIQDQLESLKNKEYAFNRYWFIKPNQLDQEFEKISFDRRLPALGWYIGSGAYLDDIEETVKKQSLEMLASVNLGNSGYFFVSHVDGASKLKNQKLVTDGSLSLFASNEKKHQQMIESATRGDFLTYHIPDIDDPSIIHEKMSYVRLVDSWNWVIGTGFYLSEVNELIARKKQELIEQHNIELAVTLSFSVLFTVLLTVLTFVLGRGITRRFIRLEERIISDYERLESTNNKLQYMAEYDALTNLPNRTQLKKHIEKHIGLSKLEKKQVAIVFVDLDDFKHINDQYGHTAGDQLLQQIGARFKHIIGKSDFVARFGGDEFVFCFSLLRDENEAQEKVECIKNAFELPFLLSGMQVSTSCSIGVSMFPNDGHSAESLISKADIVLYKIKEQDKGKALFYNFHINEQVQHEFLLENLLRNALINNEINVVYQPQIHAETQQIIAVEALCRWNNQEVGFVSPLEFIPLAERTGLIYDIGEFVFLTACKDTLALMPNGKNAIGVSINISPKQFARASFEDDILAMVKEVGIDISRITLEITENIFIDDLQSISPVLNRLRDKGFGISLDDFGTGYSSLNYLHNLPITEIKIDRSFIDKLLSNTQSDTLVKAIIAIGASCQMTVVAEGVETDGQHQRLKEYQCDLLQGYYFDKPLRIAELVSRYPTKKEAVASSC